MTINSICQYALVYIGVTPIDINRGRINIVDVGDCTPEWIFILIFMALIMEIVDSSLGMMYGTILSPLLVIFGFEPVLVVPAILLSQAIGGMGGTFFHHKFKNADFNGFTKDTKIMIAMVLPGLLVVILGVFVALNLSQFLIKLYIGILVVAMSMLCLSPISYKFAWWKHYAIGMLAAFNKSLSGGGFGPVTSTGGILGGLEPRVSVATTTFAEAPICLASFIAYIFLFGITNLVFISSLCIGALVGGIIGPFIASKIDQKRLRILISLLGISTGFVLLFKVTMLFQ